MTWSKKFLPLKGKMMGNNPTTRRHPRTLDEAFGCDGFAITKYPRRRSRLWDVLFAIALGLLGAMMLVEGLVK